MYDIPEEELSLRDNLAIDRTRLANERTLLSYSRTGFSLVVTALAIFEFSDKDWAHLSAWVLIGLGLIIAVIGLLFYLRIRRKLNQPRKASKKKV